LTASGHPRSEFRRAIERGNLSVAETTAREMGHVSLLEALQLTALLALRDRGRGSRFAVRWLERLVDERPAVTIDEVALAASALAALGGPAHDIACATLTSFVRDRT
jgi:hypothetical protein